MYSFQKEKKNIKEIYYYAHFSSKTEKSETRSHTLSPLRAALEEYAGPMPFLVVPKLKNKGG